MPELPSTTCTGCGTCAQICPVHAIDMRASSEGFLYPFIKTDTCVVCNVCEKRCPINQVKKRILISEKPFIQRKSFASITNNDKIRVESSSGGIFTVLAEKILSDGGIVFGAEFDEDFSIHHGWTNRVSGLIRFRGSKYVQSRIESCFIKCKNFLDKGLTVLFTGTPCQIAGLRSFLNNDYNNLFCVDLICHGVPSPLLWQKYIKFIEKKSYSKIAKISFRCKNNGWKMFSLCFTFSDQSEYKEIQTEGMWMCSFNKNVMMRNSCYNCFFKGDNILSDITIGDFWGIEQYVPEKDDDKGYSICYINTKKGESLFDDIQGKIYSSEIKSYNYQKYNAQILYSLPFQKKRENFINCVLNNSFEAAYNKYVKEKKIIRIYKKIRRDIGKILRKMKLKK